MLTPGQHASTRVAAPVPLPAPDMLAALGPVLCLYRARAGGELSGWTQAVRAESVVALDSDGVYESLRFLDAVERCCWQLFLLPDSDFYAWEWLAARLPAHVPPPAPGDVAARLWSKLARGMHGECWHASALRLHALRYGPAPAASGGPVLAASPVAVSAVGKASVRRILRMQGIDAAPPGGECCCELAAREASRLPRAPAARTPARPIRLRPGERT